MQPGWLHTAGFAPSEVGHGDAGDGKEQEPRGEGDGKEQREGRRVSMGGQGSH